MNLPELMTVTQKAAIMTARSFMVLTGQWCQPTTALANRSWSYKYIPLSPEIWGEKNLQHVAWCQLTTLDRVLAPPYKIPWSWLWFVWIPTFDTDKVDREIRYLLALVVATLVLTEAGCSALGPYETVRSHLAEDSMRFTRERLIHKVRPTQNTHINAYGHSPIYLSANKWRQTHKKTWQKNPHKKSYTSDQKRGLSVVCSDASFYSAVSQPQQGFLRITNKNKSQIPVALWV